MPKSLYFSIISSILLLLSFSPASAQPQRIVSMNLCADLLVLLLAPPQNIVSVTFLASDPAYSPLTTQTKGLYLNHGLAEQIIPLKPDVVLTSPYSNRFTNQLLTQLGFKVVEIPVATSLTSVYAIIEQVGNAVGELAKAQQMVATMQQQLATLRLPATYSPTVIVYLPNGYVYGGYSLVDDVLKQVGLRNLASEMGLGYWAYLTVEDLLLAQPDIIILNSEHSDKPALATQQQQHPALAKFWSARQIIEVPSQLWQCGNPFLVEAMQHLLAQMTLDNSD